MKQRFLSGRYLLKVFLSLQPSLCTRGAPSVLLMSSLSRQLCRLTTNHGSLQLIRLKATFTSTTGTAPRQDYYLPATRYRLQRNPVQVPDGHVSRCTAQQLMIVRTWFITLMASTLIGLAGSYFKQVLGLLSTPIPITIK